MVAAAAGVCVWESTLKAENVNMAPVCEIQDLHYMCPGPKILIHVQVGHTCMLDVEISQGSF